MSSVSNEQLYRIKPLRWTKAFDDWQQVYESDSARMRKRGRGKTRSGKTLGASI